MSVWLRLCARYSRARRTIGRWLRRVGFARVAVGVLVVGCVTAGLMIAVAARPSHPGAARSGGGPSASAGSGGSSSASALRDVTGRHGVPVNTPVLSLSDPHGAPLTSGIAPMPEPPRVAPLRGLRQADLLIVAPFTLPESVRAQISRLSGVTSAQPIEAAKVRVNGAYAAVLGVDPSAFRGYAVKPVASSDPLWQGVADGGIAVSYSMGTLNRLRLGGPVAVAGQVSEQLPVVAFGTLGIPGVDAVVSDTVAMSLGMPTANALVVSGSPATLSGLAKRIGTLLPKGAAVEQLVFWVTRPAGGATALVGSTAGNPAACGSFIGRNQLVAVLQAALSRRGQPYVWGGSGPGVFDCSGLIQWSFAQAGLVMPRVAADQALTGPAVPASQLAAGDLLFYRTDPTDPGYISHVAMYLGNGWMIQAPEPGRTVEVVPVDLGSEYAGAVRVDPPVASQLAGRIT